MYTSLLTIALSLLVIAVHGAHVFFNIQPVIGKRTISKPVSAVALICSTLILLYVISQLAVFTF